MKLNTFNKKYLILKVIIIVIISLCISIGLSIQWNTIDLKDISNLCYNNNQIVLTNLNNNNINVLKFNTDGIQSGLITYPLIKNATYNYNIDIIPSKEDTFIHIAELDSTNGLIEREKVMLCDFNNNSLNNNWEIPITENTFEQYAFGTTIIDNDLYYISVKENIATLNKIDTNNTHSIVYDFSMPTYEIIQWNITNDLQIIGYSSYGGIFIMNENNIKKIYPLNNDVTSIVNFEYHADKLYFTDLNSNKNIIYNLSINSYSSNNISNYDNVNFSSLKNVHHIDDTSFVAVYDFFTDYNRIAISKDNDITIIDNIKYELSFNTSIIKYFLISFIIITILSFIIKSYINSEKCIFINIKILMIFILVFSIGIPIITNNIKSSLKDNIISSRYNNLIIDAENIAYDYNLYNLISNINEVQTFDKNLYNTLENIFDTEIFSDIANRNFRKNNELKSQYYAFHILNEDNNLITLKNKGSLENIPTEYLYNKSIIEQYKNTIEDGIPLKLIKNTSLGEYYTLAYPIENAIIEIGVEKYIIDNEINSYLNKFIIMISIIIIFLIIIFVLILTIYLKDIKRLLIRIKNNYFNNNYVISKKVYTNEIIEINDIFENMMVSINKYQLETENNNISYSKFVSSDIFSLMNVNNILEIKTGDSKQTTLYNMNIDLTFISKENFHSNIDTIMKVLRENNAIIDYFNLSYMEVFFKENPKNILKTSIEIIKKLDNKVNISLSYGIAIPTVIGSINRLETMIVSKQKNITENLSNICKKFNFNLLISEYFLEQLSDINQFNICLIGNVSINDECIKVYNVLDNLPQINQILYTKKDFETGVKYFLNKDFINALKYFVNVLRYNNNDVMAKEYLKMCEQYITNNVNSTKK